MGVGAFLISDNILGNLLYTLQKEFFHWIWILLIKNWLNVSSINSFIYQDTITFFIKYK